MSNSNSIRFRTSISVRALHATDVAGAADLLGIAVQLARLVGTGVDLVGDAVLVGVGGVVRLEDVAGAG
ncbi:MAG: hypothetical protein QM820_27175 [Minicystis sp.]